jgi:hypothetical protein
MQVIKKTKQKIMRKLFLTIAIAITVFLTGCIKNDLKVWTGSKIEFDAASWNANAAGLTYPIVTRVPAYGAAVNTTNSPTLLNRTTGSFLLRVNLVGPQLKTDTQFTFQVSSSESTAVQGTHYTALTGTGTIPANSSFGYITVNVLNPGATSGSVILVLQLTDNSNFKASVNYAKVGLSIAQN